MNIYKVTKAISSIKVKGTGRIANMIKDMMLPKMEPGMTVKTLYGFRMTIDPIADERGLEKSIYRHGTYEEGTLKVIGSVVREGDLFVDIGANIGLMSLFVANALHDKCRIVAFEPNHKTHEMLTSNVQINGFKSIRVESYAISDTQQASKIYDRWDTNRGASTLIKPDFETTSYDIEETTLDSYFENEGQIRLMKIDIEGYELKALRGATKLLNSENPPALILEYSENTGSSSEHELYDHVVALGKYRIFKHEVWKGVESQLVEVKNSSELPKHDNIYCFTEKHLASITHSIFKVNPE